MFLWTKEDLLDIFLSAKTKFHFSRIEVVTIYFFDGKVSLRPATHSRWTKIAKMLNAIVKRNFILQAFI